jgi:hypothetical protein
MLASAAVPHVALLAAVSHRPAPVATDISMAWVQAQLLEGGAQCFVMTKPQ